MIAPLPLPDRLWAITVWQPWASLIVKGFKRYEFREWSAPKLHHYQPLAIHAGKKPPSHDDLRTLQYRIERDNGLSLFGTTLSPEALEHALHIIRSARYLPHGAYIGTTVLGVPITTSEFCATHHVPVPPGGNLTKWAWPMFPSEARQPVQAHGKQGFFKMEVPPDWKDASHV